MGTAVEFMKLSRFHTIPLEGIIGFSAGLLATERVDVALICGLYGAVYHVWGYGTNSVLDYKKGYDKDDENKQNHPLNTGTISETDGMVFSYLFLALLTIMYLVMIRVTNRPVEESLLIPGGMMVAQVFAGQIYNEYAKKMYNSWLPISIAHMLVFTIPYYLFAGVDGILYMGSIFVFFWTFYQIAISGEYKDLAQKDEKNFLRHHGYRLSESWKSGDLTITSTSVLMMATGMVLASLYSGYILLGLTGVSGVGWLMTLLITSSLTVVMLTDSKYERETSMQLIVMKEAGYAYFLYLTALSLLSTWELLVFAPIPILWVLASNRVMWGSVLTPDV